MLHTQASCYVAAEPRTAVRKAEWVAQELHQRWCCDSGTTSTLDGGELGLSLTQLSKHLTGVEVGVPGANACVAATGIGVRDVCVCGTWSRTPHLG